jgi:hypothetical protein
MFLAMKRKYINATKYTQVGISTARRIADQVKERMDDKFEFFVKQDIIATFLPCIDKP